MDNPQGPSFIFGMSTDSWAKHTLTAVLGVCIGVVATLSNMTINNASRLSALEENKATMTETLRRIELKVDSLQKPR